MAHPTIDQIVKEMAEHHPQAFIRLIFPRAKHKVISTKLDKELTIRTRLTDKVIRLKTKNGDRLIHLEFQLRYHRKIPERVFVYAGGLTAKYQVPVASILFLIKPSRKIGDFGVYTSEVYGKQANQFSFPVIHLWKLRDAILSGEEQFRVFAPLLFEIEPKPNAKLLRRVRDIINLETHPQRRAEFLSFAIPIARRHFGLGLIQSIFKESDMTNVEWEKLPYFGEAIKESSKKAIQEGREKGREEGRQEGRQEGEMLATQEMLVEFLAAQFGHVPLKTMRAIRAIRDRQKLKTLTRKLMKAASPAEAHKLLAESKTRATIRNGVSSSRVR